MAGSRDSVLPEESAGIQLLHPVHLQALEALRASGVPSLVLRLPVAEGRPPGDLDLLIAASSIRQATEVLVEVGFLPKTSPLGLPSKVVFATFDGNRFHSLDVHTSVVSRGLVYLDAETVLRRRVERGGCPLPSFEDSLLHLVLHPLLARLEIGGKYVRLIEQLDAQPLDRQYLQWHLSRFGLADVFRQTLEGVLGKSRSPRAAVLWRQARGCLLRRAPLNLLRRGRYRLAAAVRFRRKSALVAFVGVDGVGKSALVSTLERLLCESGLRTASLYLGCWGRYQTRVLWVRNYSPRDSPPGGETKRAAISRILKNVVKFGVFHGALLYEETVRYWRGVVRSQAHVVLSDRYIYDLEIPFSRRYVRAGRWVRRWIYWIFPTPDLIFHLHASPPEIRARKPELTEEQIVRFDRIYEEVLVGRPAVRLRVEGTPEELAREIVEGHWKEFLTACWNRAPRCVLPREGRGR